MQSAPYICQWRGLALLQVEACRLFGTKPLPEPMLTYCQWDCRNKLQWNSHLNSKHFLHENAYEQYCQWNDVHFVQGRWVNNLRTHETCYVFIFVVISLLTSDTYYLFLYIIHSCITGIGGVPFCSGLNILIYPRHSTNTLTHWGCKMAATSRMIFSNAFSWMKMYEFWLKCHGVYSQFSN